MLWGGWCIEGNTEALRRLTTLNWAFEDLWVQCNAIQSSTTPFRISSGMAPWPSTTL